MNSWDNSWFAVSGSSDLPPGSARAVLLRGEDIVIWRSEQRVVQAWQNKCIHRGMRLSFGQVRGEQLSCRYHGWLFDHAGQCTRMPAQPELVPAKTLCVPGYNCVERNDLIWISRNDSDLENLDALLSSEPMRGPWIFCRTLYQDGNADVMQEKLTTATYPLFCQPGGQTEVQSKVQYRSNLCPPNSIVIAAENSTGEVDKVSITLQPMSDNRTGLHISTLTTGDAGLDKSKLVHFHRWARRLRWFLQHPCAEYDGLPPLAASSQQPDQQSGQTES